MVASPLKIHGGKGGFNGKLAKWIIGHMPSHLVYVEPFAGGLSVLLHKDPEGVSEVINDLNFELTVFWRVLGSDMHFREFLRLAQTTPFSEVEWADAADIKPLNGELSISGTRVAAAFFTRCRQSMAGRMKSFAPLSKTRTRKGMNEQAAAWMTAVDGLPEVHARLRRVIVLNKPAIDVIRQLDGEQTLQYLDPPYVPQTRIAKKVYSHEMTYEDHEELLEVILACKSKIILSGYPNELYDSKLKGWRKEFFSIPNNAASGKEKRRMTEVLWLNY